MPARGSAFEVSSAEQADIFRQLAENIREVFWMTPLDLSEMIYISPAFETVWGRSCDSLYENPQSFLDAVHPDDYERVRAAVMADRSLRHLNLEYRILRPDGEVRYIHDRSFPVPDATGKVYRIAGLAQDVTERKLADELLLQTQRTLQEVLSATGAILFIGEWDEGHEFVPTYISPNARDVLGARNESVLNDPEAWRKPVHPDDRPGLASASEQLARFGHYTIEFRFLHADGTYRWLLASGRVQNGVENGKRKVAGYWIDISARREAEQALLRSYELLAEAQAIAEVGTWEYNPAVDQLVGSAETFRLLGLPHAPIPLGRFFQLLHPDDRARVEARIEVAMTNHEQYDVSYRVIRPSDGQLRYLHARGRVVEGGSCFLGSLMDITEQQRAEEERETLITELQESLRQVKTLSGMLPICSSCKKIRNDQGYWTQIESYVSEHTGAEFSHGICPPCLRALYPDLAEEVLATD